ncbi:MAG: lactonase family protein [Gammaproteobacteria bacterium]|nr:lactonase family protein [Gammaproteobacteria bacterium]
MAAIVYVSNAGSGEVMVFALDEATGALSRVQAVSPTGKLMPLALSPARDRLYVARRSEPLAVIGYAIDAATGHLSPVGEAPLPHSMAFITTDRSGRFLLSASYGGNLVAVSAMQDDGRWATAQVVPTPPNAHCIQVDPTNRHVYATSLGAGVLMHWHFDAASGALSPAEPFELPLPAGCGPRHFVFDRGGSRIYLLGELDGSVSVLRVEPATGDLALVQTVSLLPPGFSGKPWAADLHLTPDGRWLVASERTSSTLATFAVDATNGTLTPVAHTPTETQPRGFAIDPAGRWLVAAGEQSGRIASYRIDSESGTLAHCGSAPAGLEPNWVEIVALPARASE